MNITLVRNQERQVWRWVQTWPKGMKTTSKGFHFYVCCYLYISTAPILAIIVFTLYTDKVHFKMNPAMVLLQLQQTYKIQKIYRSLYNNIIAFHSVILGSSIQANNNFKNLKKLPMFDYKISSILISKPGHIPRPLGPLSWTLLS